MMGAKAKRKDMKINPHGKDHYGMIVGMIVGGKADNDGETKRRFNPNNVINFDESLGYTPYWYVKHPHS